jgi:ClpP class serine protease
MTAADLLWLFFIASALQPVLQKKFLEAMRQRKISEIERARGSRVILLVHRQETMSFLGFPLMRFINIEDSEAVIRAIQLTDDNVPVDIILHTPGGLVLAATQIARTLKSHPGKTTVFVPHYAMSGGTLIALAADEIHMSEHAVLGPIDPQLGQKPAASVLKVLKEKEAKDIDDETLILADMSKKAIAQVKRTAEKLLEGDMEPAKVKKLAQTLSEGRWTHDYPILPDEARELGLKISTDMPQAIYELMNLYPQPSRAVPSVEYLPEKRTGKGGGIAPRGGDQP